MGVVRWSAAWPLAGGQGICVDCLSAAVYRCLEGGKLTLCGVSVMRVGE